VADRLAHLRGSVDAALDGFLRPDAEIPPLILEAARYAVLGPGKRLRPILVLASGEAASGHSEGLMPAACAVEMIHAFSLVHDDLPALDDDSLRRGRPTVHVKFDEATAILAGDALLNLAFEILATQPGATGQEGARLRAIAAVARAVGLRGMIGGQVLDLEFEGKVGTREDLERIHRLKTGCLITASCVAGAILSGADDGAIAALERYGRALGLAFQITDDILDVTGSAEEIGKSPGKDAAAAKTTFPSLFGLEASRKMAAEQVDAALGAISNFGARSSALAEIARSIASRRS